MEPTWIKVTDQTLPEPGIYIGWCRIKKQEVIVEFSMFNPSMDDDGNVDETVESEPCWIDYNNLVDIVEITHYRQIFFNTPPNN